MFLPLLFLINYKNKHTIKTSTSAIFLSDFGFESNASFSVAFENLDSHVCFTFVSKDDYKSVRNKMTVESVYCEDFNNSKYFHLFTPNSQLPYEGNIIKKGIYFPLVVDSQRNLNKLTEAKTALSASKSIQSSKYIIDAQVTEIFVNPNSHLDYRWNGIIEGKIGILVVVFIFLIFWFINWFRNFSIQIWLHYCLTGVFVSYLINQTIRFFLLKKMIETDDTYAFSIFSTIFSLFSEIIFYATILLCAKGWCVVRDSISIKEIILCLTYSTLFMIFRILAEKIVTGSWAIVVIILALISIIFFIRELLKSINNAHLLILAHLLAIANAGYDIKTTPIYQKHVMYNSFSILLLTSLVLILIYMIVYIFIDIPYVADELTQDSIQVFFLGGLILLFRLRGGKRRNYTLISGGSSHRRSRRNADGGGNYNSFNDDNNGENIININEDEDGHQEDAENDFSTTTDEISLADLESISINSPLLNRGGREWTEDLPLPGIPVIVPNRTANSSTLQDSLTRNMNNLMNQRNNLEQPQQSQNLPEATVILASPDGTNTVQANVIDPGQVRHEI